MPKVGYYELRVQPDLKVSNELIAIYFRSFEIFNIQIIIKSNYFQNVQKGEYFLDDFEALIREIYVRG
jgi:hypothetical protein